MGKEPTSGETIDSKRTFWIKMAHCMFVGSKSGRDEEKIPETWFMTKGLDVAVGITSWWLLKLSTWRCCQKVCKCRQECAARLGKVRGTSGKGLGQAHFRRYAIIMWGLVSWGSWLWDIKAQADTNMLGASCENLDHGADGFPCPSILWKMNGISFGSG